MSECYFCPLQETAFENCSGCPFLSSEGGRHFCHLATRNFFYEGKACELGIFPLVYAREYHCAEVRFINEGGKKVAQINLADLEGTEETRQANIAMDSKPCKLSYFKRRKRKA